ncbi:MAG: cytochrome c [Nitrospirae bacterium]|nr:cytochrome c [Nitrospirota bacterium]
MGKIRLVTTITCAALLLLSTAIYAADDIQKQVDDIRGALPKFAVPMREVGDRFQNMYFAAKEGNWALAAYMSKYMDKAMNPAKVTKPTEYEAWKTFYAETFAPVNKAIQAQDMKAFEKEHNAVIQHCNNCHAGMGYGFIKVIKMQTPADAGIDYKVTSKATDVPK